MAETRPAFAGPITEDALIADRQRFWHGFLNATVGFVAFLVILLVLMAIFLV